MKCVCEIVYLGQEPIPGTVEKQEAAILLQHEGLTYQMRYTDMNEMPTKLVVVQEDTNDNLGDCSFIQESMGDQSYAFRCKAKPELYLCVKSGNSGNEVLLCKPGQQHENVFQFYSENETRRHIMEKFVLKEKIGIKGYRKRIHQRKIPETSEGVNILEKKTKSAVVTITREHRYQTRSSARKNSPKIKTTSTFFLEGMNILEKKRKCAIVNPKRECRYQTRSSARKNSQRIKTRK
ncbi:uncharacterized protein [Phyllobates terribilis]|uniref:uncharacterized protein isoform X2 n=1 Tax=Phyllobates terribilis TaxID=111132 RepID=UPI003CCB1A11